MSLPTGPGISATQRLQHPGKPPFLRPYSHTVLLPAGRFSLLQGRQYSVPPFHLLFIPTSPSSLVHRLPVPSQQGWGLPLVAELHLTLRAYAVNFRELWAQAA